MPADRAAWRRNPFHCQKSLDGLGRRSQLRLMEWLIRRTSLLDGDTSPPSWIDFTGRGDYHRIGRGTATTVAERTGLKGGERVLDMGCGIARAATALAEMFPELRYEGFDIVRYGIEWSRKSFRDRPNFRFTHADVRNGVYNPGGTIDPAVYRFPYERDRFDVAFAASLFTHLLEDAARRYVAEAARVVRPGGLIYVTTFVYRPDLPKGAALRFERSHGEAFVLSSQDLESAVAYAPSFWAGLAAEHGLVEVGRFGGGWRKGRSKEFQDAILYRNAA